MDNGSRLQALGGIQFSYSTNNKKDDQQTKLDMYHIDLNQKLSSEQKIKLENALEKGEISFEGGLDENEIEYLDKKTYKDLMEKYESSKN